MSNMIGWGRNVIMWEWRMDREEKWMPIPHYDINKRTHPQMSNKLSNMIGWGRKDVGMEDGMGRRHGRWNVRELFIKCVIVIKLATKDEL